MEKLKIDKNLLQWLVERQSPTCSQQSLIFITELANYLKEKGFDVKTDHANNIYAVKKKDENFSGFYPCFVSHTDTSQNLHKKIELIEKDGFLIGWDGEKQVGPGFDDKVGICISLQLAEQFDNVKLFFASDEESGCIGSSQADLSFFNDVSFCAQPDRRGDSDFIYYTNRTQVVSEEFINHSLPLLDRYKYNLNEGSFTDIGCLVNRGIGICCFNISCGYYNEHTNQERLDLSAAEKCLNFLYDFTKSTSYKRWVYNPEDGMESTNTYIKEKIIDLTVDLLYELEFVNNLPPRVKLLVNQLNRLLYEDQYNQSIWSFSAWDDLFNSYNGWNNS
ncbi:MAG: hypothetical protein NZZ41_02660 [Candidatus Dojkabacteria bacterium]|nr:hypothetical protein [Candidatus Dojkabacteria bacterium]